MTLRVESKLTKENQIGLENDEEQTNCNKGRPSWDGEVGIEGRNGEGGEKGRSEQGRRKKEIGKEEDGITKIFWREILHLHDTFFLFCIYMTLFLIKMSQENFEKRIPRWD
jgi:hypothetical protein